MKDLFLGIYKNRKVLVTGHTGFKGSWLTLWLVNLGANVLGYSLPPPTSPSLFRSLNLRRKIKHVTGDVRNLKKLSRVIGDFKPEIIFHLAAQPLVWVSYQDPLFTYETNIMGTLNLYEAIRKEGCSRAVVTVTSDKCYENREWVFGYRETDSLGGHDPYSSSKGCQELVTSAYMRSYFPPERYGKEHFTGLCSARAGNVIGGGDFAEGRLVPDCIRGLVAGKDIIIRNPQSVRPWQFVLEPLSGYLWVGALLHGDGPGYCEPWNFGPGNDEEELTVEELAKAIIKWWGRGKLKKDRKRYPHEARLLKLDISKAVSQLKWTPLYGISKAVDETASWYKALFERKEDMFRFSTNQILGYVESAKNNNMQWSRTHETG